MEERAAKPAVAASADAADVVFIMMSARGRDEMDQTVSGTKSKK